MSQLREEGEFQEKKKEIKLPIMTPGTVLRILFLVHSLKIKTWNIAWTLDCAD